MTTDGTSDGIGRIGRYELLARLGTGGMGEVFLARVTGAAGFESQVVIKRILPHLATNPDFVRRFIDEGKLVVKLRHAAIAQVLDLGDDGNAVFIAMEYVEGRDLRELIRLSRASGRDLPVDIACSILAAVLEALDYAHRLTDAQGKPLGIIHRDVSPSNVMISRAGNVKLLDFGIARAAERLSASISGAIQGKFSYMSPQQAAGVALDARSDQFATGVMAWEMLAGRRPFDGATDLDTLDRVRHHDPGSLADALPAVPEEVATAVDRMLAKTADRRFASADDARRALQSYLNRVESTVGARELAAWMESLLATLPPELRDHPAAALSVDDALRLSLDPSTPASDATRTLAPSDDTPVGGKPVPGTEPAAAISLPPTPDGTPQTVSQIVVERRSRLTPLLILFNVLLLAAVGWFIYQGTLPEEQIVAAPVPPPTRASDEGEAGRGETTVEEVAQLAEAEAQLDASNAGSADGGTKGGDAEQMPVTAGRSAGAELAGAAISLLERATVVDVSTTPAASTITIRETGSTGPAPRSIWVESGVAVEALVRAERYSGRSVSLDPKESTSVHVVLKAEERGTVTFRFFPANAQVAIDGRGVPNEGSNLVEKSLTTGQHSLILKGPGGSQKSVRFTIRAGQTTNLKTLTLDAAASDAGGDEP